MANINPLRRRRPWIRCGCCLAILCNATAIFGRRLPCFPTCRNIRRAAGRPVVFGALSVLVCFAVFGVKQGRKWGRLALLCLLWALAPFLLCSIRAFNPDKVYALMTYSVSGLYLLGMVMLDALPGVLERLKGKRPAAVFLSGASWVMLACTVVCLFHWTVSANLEFYLARMDYENMYAQCSAYLARAESSEDYVQGMPIVVIGESGYNSGRAERRCIKANFTIPS